MMKYPFADPDSCRNTTHQLRIALAGAGNRARRYAGHIASGTRAAITAAADPDQARLNRLADICDRASLHLFPDAEEMLRAGAGNLFDAVIIATPEQSHYRLAMLALSLGLDILVEKPIGITLDQCLDIAETAKRTGLVAGVCHVLRYHPFFIELHRLVKSHTSGRIITIDHTVNVGIDRAIHTFVRSPWGNSALTSPMILSKCCHDFDLLLWLSGATLPCRVSSFGSTGWFTSGNAPEGSSNRCIDCKIEKRCPYSAIDMYRRRGVWTDNFDISPDECRSSAIERQLRYGPFGKCVFHAGSDVVDRQSVAVEFNDGMLFNLSLRLFTTDDSRRTVITFTDGEIEADQRRITYTPLRGKPEIIDLSETTPTDGHGGADYIVVDDFIEAVTVRNHTMASTIENSIESHLLCFAAEQSRETGQIVTVNPI